MPRRVSVKRVAQRVATQDAKLRDNAAKAKSSGHVEDSFQNFALKIGIGTDNALSLSSYGFNPITRIRPLLEWIYRGSWLAGVSVDLVAEDMTRTGVEIESDLAPEDATRLQAAVTNLGIWKALTDTLKWGRLYGGALAVMLIDGQDPATPLNLDRIGKGQFKGILPLDRWMVDPSIEDLVTDLGPSLGLPKYYRVITAAPALRGQRIHHSRCARFGGIKLPYWQRVMENLWEMSVIERLYDRMIAFDSATMGASQLVYKSYLRTFKVKDLRKIAAAGGPAMEGLAKYTALATKFQSIEGMTLIDSEDEFEGHAQNANTGISSIMDNLAQQLAGALQIPIVRLLGEAPRGLNATGESDLRTYYDGIKQQQEATLRLPLQNIFIAVARSEQIELDDDFTFGFRPLWMLSDKERAEMSNAISSSVSQQVNDGTISRQTALRELKASSRETGVFSTITDEEIAGAEDEVPSAEDLIVAAQRREESGEPGEEGDAGASEGAGGEKKANGHARDARYNYDLGGLQVMIESPKGTTRTGKGWMAIMPADYGHIRGVTGADGDNLDCFVGPNRSSDRVWLIEQRRLDGSFDENKVMLGYDNEADALHDYVAAHSDGQGFARIKRMLPMSIDELRQWMAASNQNNVVRL